MPVAIVLYILGFLIICAMVVVIEKNKTPEERQEQKEKELETLDKNYNFCHRFYVGDKLIGHYTILGRREKEIDWFLQRGKGMFYNKKTGLVRGYDDPEPNCWYSPEEITMKVGVSIPLPVECLPKKGEK